MLTASIILISFGAVALMALWIAIFKDRIVYPPAIAAIMAYSFLALILGLALAVP